MTFCKIGKLKYIAKSDSKGIKLEEEPNTWYNPETEDAKSMLVPELIGRIVELHIKEENSTKFFKIEILKEAEDIEEETETKIPEDVVSNECVSDEPVKSSLGVEYEKKDDGVYRVNPSGDKYNYNVVEGKAKDIFKTLKAMALETEQKGPHKLTYASWAEAWDKLKEKYPLATFEVHENGLGMPGSGMPYFYDTSGAFVKVSVTIEGLTHTVHLPVIDHANNPMKKEAYSIMKSGKQIHVAGYTAFDIHKSIQRALTKAIALHGLGLYVFKGEDFPEERK